MPLLILFCFVQVQLSEIQTMIPSHNHSENLKPFPHFYHLISVKLGQLKLLLYYFKSINLTAHSN